MKMSDLVQAVKDHAVANYNDDGWDFVVECFEDDEIQDEIRGARTGEEAIQMMSKIVKIKDEQRKEIQSTIF